MTYDMDTTIVEATSLSAITNIAANPPQHAGVPHDIPRLALVLYIARVPGSRDVFLTPMKPREKVVTAEDVSSSLYYIHVNSPEDYDDTAARPSSVNTDASHLLPIREESWRRNPVQPRRPVAPPTPPYPMDDGPPRLNLRTPSPPRHSRLARKPVGSSNSSNSHPSALTPGLPVLSRRPLPSPPADEQPYEPSLHAHNKHLLRRAESSDENNPYSMPLLEPSVPFPDPADLPPPGSLTLIRRDPASCDQWNVAFIHDPPLDEVSSAALRNPTAAQRTKRSGAPLFLDISNPAYEQFIKDKRPGSRVSQDTASSGNSDAPEGIFRRRLYMPSSKYSAHEYSQHARFGSVAPLEDGTSSSRHLPKRSSMDFYGQSSYADRRNKGYTFSSPWDARCEFSTGVSGKSLKCKHHLPSTYGGTIAVEVSELRFNLPTASSKIANTPLSDKRSPYMSGLHRRLHSSSDSGSVDFVFDDEGKLDLTLGQEKAGGGFGGKQAKLGKLIIQPEGLGMLDLLVAANIGLWWRAWGR
ncbi:hypothetical protein Slin15195_G099860 [Septoria linicola]|uniref:Uncharacterized protein n=1 Tax=Septoria linicola TaxID=215465 RepID=A0A9Q9B3C9_9PEZI|nr:hypothetical protein Slin14017_G062900 [Septoria linicola]USW56667.1 hypothetical protein Slin15195_G099860 [Septoria linicola]